MILTLTEEDNKDLEFETINDSDNNDNQEEGDVD